jgi:Phospholipid methyltransferase
MSALKELWHRSLRWWNYRSQSSSTSAPLYFSLGTPSFYHPCGLSASQEHTSVILLPIFLTSGDYFGILMDDMVTSFPFNVLNNPMYVGSAMSFFGTSFWYGKPVGFLLSIEVCFMYFLAMLLEGPFTTKIYAMRDEYFRMKAEREAKKDE